LTNAGVLQFAVSIDSGGWGMGGKSPVAASAEQRAALTALAGSRDRGEADRARAVLLTLLGWTSARIAEAFGVREDCGAAILAKAVSRPWRRALRLGRRR
jgi:hypothetical protein